MFASVIPAIIHSWSQVLVMVGVKMFHCSFEVCKLLTTESGPVTIIISDETHPIIIAIDFVLQVSKGWIDVVSHVVSHVVRMRLEISCQAPHLMSFFSPPMTQFPSRIVSEQEKKKSKVVQLEVKEDSIRLKVFWRKSDTN